MITKGFDKIGNLNEEYAYDTCFKGLAGETVYVDSMAKVDRRNTEKRYLEKYMKELYDSVPVALKSIASTAISAPTIIDADIVDTLRKETPVLELIPRVTNKGKVASYNQLTTRNAAAFMTEGASLNDQDDAYTNQTANVKYSYAIGGVTGVAQAHEAHYIDAFAEVVRSKTVALRELHESKFLTGSSTTDANEYNGMDNIISTNSTSNSSATLLLDTVGTQLDACRTYGGRGKKIGVTDFATLRSLKSQMMANERYIDRAEIAWGLMSVMYEDMPLVASRFSATGTNAKVFYIIDTEVTQYRVLQEPTMEDLAKTYDGRRFFIKEYSVPICKHEARNAMQTSIK